LQANSEKVKAKLASCKAAAFCPYNPGMPIYEYECRKCKAHIEAFQKVSDKPLTKCRKCGGRLDKQISAPAIQFKGSGWYVTDYAGKATKGEASESQTTSETAAAKDKTDKTGKTDKKSTAESSPAKKTSEKASPTKASSSD
jgi:putative FmdB family regulatory protein